MTEYEYEKYITTASDAKKTLDTFGVAIIPNVLNQEECDAMNYGMWDTLEHLSQTWENPIRRDNPDSWREMRRLYPLHSMLLQHWSVGHAQYVWNVRQNPKVVSAFASIWGCPNEKLLVSFDGVSYHLPPETTNIGWYRGNTWYHTDQSYLDNEFKCVQGWISGYDTNEGDATLCIMEGTHKFHQALQEEFGIEDKNDWYKLTRDQEQFYLDRGCQYKRIKCPRGSLVLWDSRTVHCGGEPIKGRELPNFRNVVYVCYQPRSKCDAKNLAKKKKAFEEMRMTSHWPCQVKLFPKMPRTYGGEVPEITQLAAPELTDLGKILAGVNDPPYRGIFIKKENTVENEITK